jgi:hypothetical protein
VAKRSGGTGFDFEECYKVWTYSLVWERRRDNLEGHGAIVGDLLCQKDMRACSATEQGLDVKLGAEVPLDLLLKLFGGRLFVH